MFTGIIEAKGSVVSLTPNEFGVRLVIDPTGGAGQGIAQDVGDAKEQDVRKPDAWTAFPKRGDSVAVNGCCLTYNPVDGDDPATLGFDVIRESLDKTSLGQLEPGSAVNLELALTPSTAIGGHFVQGHVDGKGSIADINSTEQECVVTIETPADLMKYIVPKGSVTIDGISLTIAAIDIKAKTFNVAIIPTTLQLTTLGNANVGDVVNLEADMIVKTVVHCMSNFAAQGASGGPTLSTDLFRQAGFID